MELDFLIHVLIYQVIFKIYNLITFTHYNAFFFFFKVGPDSAAAAAAAAFFLQTAFRKPKRIRTAFTPSQLLKLENAFEGNHYVVGQERKDLAKSLNLTETQV
jgi:hypothetical protein